MQTCFVLVLAGTILASTSDAGTITGVVRARGKQAAEEGGGSKYDSRKFKFVERVNYLEMHDFVVFLEGPVGAKPVRPEKPVQVITTKRITQRGAAFWPHVLPVLVGTTVEWPNNDDIFHNVFSASETKPFDLGLYKHPEVKRVTFDKPGRVDVFCSIHTAMNCIILVLENPYFSTTDETGRYVIANVPPGTHKLKAWHERLPGQVKEITLDTDDKVNVDFTLGISNLPQY